MLFLFCIIVVLMFAICLFLFSTLKVEVENLNISSGSSKLLQDGYLITIGLYIKEIPLIKIKFDSEKVKKIDLKDKMKEVHFQERIKKIDINRDWSKILKNLEINLEEINLNIGLDTIDAIATSYLTAIISSLIGIIFGFFIKKYNEKKQKFIVTPAYINKNLINLNLSCIISLKIWNIIREIIIGRRLYLNKIKSAKIESL